MSDSIRLSSVALDCPDATGLARFYAEVTGGQVVVSQDAWATVDGPGGRIDFQTVPGYVPPVWPHPASSIQMHLDLLVEDLAAAEARVLAAGATRFDFQPNADHCLVFADPAGHPFCLTTWDDVPTAVPQPSPRAERLLAYLGAQRRHVLGMLEGLDEHALRRPVLPSGWNFLGLVSHLTADVERFWFRGVVAAEPAVIEAALQGGGAWDVGADVDPDAVLAAYRDEIEQADAVVRATRLEAAPAWWPDELFGQWRLDDVEEVLLHVITETAVHAGHVDAARELVDGRRWRVLD